MNAQARERIEMIRKRLYLACRVSGIPKKTACAEAGRPLCDFCEAADLLTVKASSGRLERTVIMTEQVDEKTGERRFVDTYKEVEDTRTGEPLFVPCDAQASSGDPTAVRYEEVEDPRTGEPLFIPRPAQASSGEASQGRIAKQTGEETPTRDWLMKRVAFYARECERQGEIIERYQRAADCPMLLCPYEQRAKDAEAKLEAAEQALREMKKEAVRIFRGFESESLNGIVCSIPDTGIMTRPHRTWCARCQDRYQRLFVLASASRGEG